jgi:nitrilase
MTKFAAIQTVSTPDVDRNLAAAGRLIERAAQAGAQWVALPE